MTRFAKMIAGRSQPLLLPGAHDALSARLIEAAGFPGFGIGGAAVAATQLGLPDIGVQSFSEYRDSVRKIVEATSLPVMVDGENGFGEAKAVRRTVQTFEAIGIAALALEDLVFPPRLGHPPSIIAADEMVSKLRVAVAARQTDQMALVGRTDAAYAVSTDEAISRATKYVEAGADVILAPGIPDKDGYARMRDAVAVPIIAILVPGSPWYVPSVETLKELGIEIALFPAAVLMHAASGMKKALADVADGVGAVPDNFGFGEMAQALNTADWASIDA